MKNLLAVILAATICVSISSYTTYAEQTPATSKRVFEFITYNEKGDGDELLLLTNFKNNLTMDEVRNNLIKTVVPNQVESIKTISANGIEKLSVSAEACGIVVEAVDGAEYTLDYIGVLNKSSITVSISTANGILSVLAHGSDADRIISTAKDSRMNVVRIGVPISKLNEIVVANGAHGCILISGVDVPVSGQADKGTVRVQSETINKAISLEAGSGSLIVRGTTISSNITMTVTNGSTRVEGETINGYLRLTASNGEVKLIADSIKNGEFTATNGDVDLKIGTIKQKVSAKISNGDLDIQLLNKPTDLAYRQTSGVNSDIFLPVGWKDGYRIGDGGASLEVSVGNGSYSLSIIATK